jgi:hypothetical protein
MKRLLEDERGIALVLALLIMVVIGITLTSLIVYTSANARNSRYAKANQVAYNLAEAGLNNALAIVENPANQRYLLQNNLLPAQMGDASCTAAAPGCSFYDGGKVVWWGTLNFETWLWTIKARGIVANPTGPGALPVTRTLSVLVQITQPPSIPNSLNVWNTLFSGAPQTPAPTPTPTACDVTFGNSGAVLAPVYVVGNLCLGNTADLEGPTYVGGWLYNMQPQTGVGLVSPISDAFIGAGCQLQSNGTFQNPCVKDGTQVNGVKAKTNVFVNNLVTSGTAPPVFNGIAAPPVDWTDWYMDASPGPWHPCWDATTSQYAPASQGPVPAFDTMVWNATTGEYEPDGAGSTGGNAPGSPVNLTPPTSYTCNTPNGGHINWNASTNALDVKGAIFIDGSAYINGVTATYTGKGVIMLSGTLDMKNATLCAVAAAGGGCNSSTGAWDPNTGSLLIFATHYTGTQVDVPYPDGIDIKSSNFQGGLYADYRINLDTTSQVQGPIVTPNTMVIGQKYASSFPSVLIAPLGLPGTQPTYQAGPPTSFSG